MARPARAVKEAGGTVLIQNPQTALHPAMPRSLAPSTVDIVADLEDIGPLLHGLLAGDAMPARPDEDGALQAFLQEVRAESGIDFTSYKAPTIGRRLQRRMVATGARTLADYRVYLRDHPEEYQRLISSFLIKVTEFFRDPELFSYLRERVLPALIGEAKGRGNDLRLWSAGCATGEEAYALAILVAEALGADLDQFTVRIFATDLDTTAIDFARRGVYPATALTPLPDDLIARYFTPVDGAYEVAKRVRGLVVFGQHDLGQRPPFPRIDLALCRNVLIYFTAELQKRALRLFAFSLRDGGYLVLGKAEAASASDEFWVPVDPQLKIYRRHGERLLLPLTQTMAAAPPAPVRLTPSRSLSAAASLRAPGGASRASSVETAESVLSGLPVGVAVVNRRYDVQTINSAALNLLGIYTAALGEDIIHLAQSLPVEPLRAAIDAAFQGAPSSSLDTVVHADTVTGAARDLQITCYPHTRDAEDELVASVMILVADVTATEQAHTQRLQQMEQAQARQEEEIERLRVQVRQVAASNRALLAANRELSATVSGLARTGEAARTDAQEAMAATEEVETLNEELQAANEELETLNEELQATIEELNTTNDDVNARDVELREQAVSLEAQRARLAAILASVGDAVLVVDPAGHTVLTNAAYERMFDDAGDPLTFIDEQGQPVPPDATPRQRAARGEPFSTRFFIVSEDPSGADARRYLEAIGQPIRNGGNEHGGVVVVRDITERHPPPQPQEPGP